ncbi:MAG: MBL fold metallo-hydrolase [Bacteroidia bacterium]
MILLLILLTFSVWVLNLPVFGNSPTNGRLTKIKNLPNYLEGELKNESPTPTKPADVSYGEMILKLIQGNKNGSPTSSLPFVTPNLNRSEELKITWFGHSSYFIQTQGKNILVDPVFSQKTSPFQFLGTKRFAGTDFISPEDFPELDLIIITHDHYDHLDYLSILKLKTKTSHFLTSLGVGEHLERWGIPTVQITELAWGESASPLLDFKFTATAARHFSGRKFKRNQTLWSSFVMQTKSNNVFIGGDSGYDNHFKEIGRKYGPFDIAILECGQYNSMWPLIHMLPEEAPQAALDLNSSILLPVHWGKFKLALHDWDEPIKRVAAESQRLNVKLVTPMLGESFFISSTIPSNAWWEKY